MPGDLPKWALKLVEEAMQGVDVADEEEAQVSLEEAAEAALAAAQDQELTRREIKFSVRQELSAALVQLTQGGWNNPELHYEAYEQLADREEQRESGRYQPKIFKKYLH